MKIGTKVTVEERGLSPRTGWCGLAMVVVIVANAVLSMALGAMPDSWTGSAREEVSKYLSEQVNLDRSLAFFAFSTLIFVFGIGFFAGLRHLADAFDDTGWTNGVVTIGAALFLAGGLVSETLHTGTAVALRSTPSYQLDANSMLLLQSLWPTALAQGQVGLGVVVMAVSYAAWRARALPSWLSVLGLGAGVLAIVRPVLVGQVPLFIALFVPMFLWIAASSVVLIRGGRQKPRDAETTNMTAPRDLASPVRP